MRGWPVGTVARSARCTLGCALVLAVALAPLPAAAAASPTRPQLGPPQALTTDDLRAPIGLGLTDVQFAWHVNDPRPGAVQAAYRIVVDHVVLAGPTRGVTPVWDSGPVTSTDQAFIPYAGPPLAPDSVYQWTVQTWAATGGPSALAAPSRFETGLRNQDWRADWIRRATNDTRDYNQYTYARKEFTLDRSPIVRARVYVSADQQYQLSVNGVRGRQGARRTATRTRSTTRPSTSPACCDPGRPTRSASSTTGTARPRATRPARRGSSPSSRCCTRTGPAS